MNTQIYRASVAAIIVNEKKEFLLTQLNIANRDEYDFVKGGMDQGENEIETLKREIKEELGNDFDYEILKRSELFIIYEWPEHLKFGSGFRGQARVSYFVFFKSGNFNLNKRELRKLKWVPEDKIIETLKKGHFRDFHLMVFLTEWEQIKKDFDNFFIK